MLLFLSSFGALYVEILVIRWIGTEVGVFAYVQNLALVACFLGFGLGCYRADKKKGLEWTLRALMGLIAMIYVPFEPWRRFLFELSNFLSLSPDAAMWGSNNLDRLSPHSIWFYFLASTAVLLTFLCLQVLLMYPLGQWVGAYLDSARDPITAYSVNLLGSVAGIWAFALLALIWLPPACWLAGAFLLIVALNPPRPRVGAVVVGLVVVAVGMVALRASRAAGIYWSPYQKLELVQVDGQREIYVNNKGYMTIADMTPAFLARHPDVADNYRTESSYDAPFRFAARSARVLIVGAGAGNDAAAALRNGAEHVDAVEIDPVIYFLGRKLHPDAPYASPKVNVILNDARAFLRDARGQYDVIVFGLLDSHTQFSDYSNMRIDNYVYTQEAFQEAAQLLNRNGILVIKFEVRPPWTWMGQRFYATLNLLFGRPPIVFYVPNFHGLVSASVFIASPDPDLRTRASQGTLAQIIRKHPPAFPLTLAAAPPLTTDNWPYVYHRGHSIPNTYLTVSLILLALAFLLVRRTFNISEYSTWHFFFLGAGFMLLETQMISRLALYFGTTWLVTAIALTAILLTLVLANFWVNHYRVTRLTRCYLVLVMALVADYLIPWERIHFSAHAVGLLLCLAYAVPAFFAGIIFAEAFRASRQKSSAFGANIFGAVAGGLAQNVSFVFGLNALLLVAGVFYALAACSWQLESRLEVS
ncbi:MAG: hypothetical protein DMG21_21455 [Acidobacteria bacterium]|nr:MAG: hypothetical protein DMG21_21455 [Acidobacteriota bacterium]